MPLSWNRLPVFLVLSAHPVPDDLLCNSIRDTTGRFRSYKWVQWATFCWLVRNFVTFSPIMSWHPQKLIIVAFSQYLYGLVAVPDKLGIDLIIVKRFDHSVTVREN
jgi:hypothetical protein